MLRKTLIYLSLILLLCSSCGHKSDFFKFDGRAQGTFYSVQYFDPQHRSLQRQIDSILLDFDRAVSLWVDSSNLNRLNCGDDSSLFPITADILEKSLYVNHLTGGAFDCRVGTLVNAWGFGAKNGTSPDSSTIDSLLLICRSDVGMRMGDNGSKIFWRDDARTEIDFNAIAQGYSVDLLAYYLDSLGITDYLIDVGGEVIARGFKKGGHPWVVGIEKPADNRFSEPEVMQAVELRNAALVTSGNYRKYYEKDGVRYSHTIDPKTGYPVNHSLLSVTVVDSTAWRADALATAFMVMGLDSSLSFINSHPEISSVYFIYDDGGRYKTYATDSFNKILNRQQ